MNVAVLVVVLVAVDVLEGVGVFVKVLVAAGVGVKEGVGGSLPQPAGQAERPTKLST